MVRFRDSSKAVYGSDVGSSLPCRICQRMTVAKAYGCGVRIAMKHGMSALSELFLETVICQRWGMENPETLMLEGSNWKA